MAAMSFLKVPNSILPDSRIPLIRTLSRGCESSGSTRSSSSMASMLTSLAAARSMMKCRGGSSSTAALSLRTPWVNRGGLDGSRQGGGRNCIISCYVAPPPHHHRRTGDVVDNDATRTRRRAMMMMTTTRGNFACTSHSATTGSSDFRRTRQQSFSKATERSRRRQRIHERSTKPVPGSRQLASFSTRASSTTIPETPHNEHQELPSSSSFIERYFSKEAATYPRSYVVPALDSNDPPKPGDVASKRWLRAMVPACVVHFSIGSVYAYSMWTPGMASALGVVANSVNDWTQAQVLPVFSCSAIVLGVTTSQFGSWIEQVGPRKAAALGTVLWTSALMTTALGVHMHSLPLVYAGWGVLGGVGWGFMYLSPLSSVLPWFPDKRGLASGITLTSFGIGAALAPIAIHSLVTHFAVPPDYIGPLLTEAATLATANDGPLSVLLDTLSDGSQVVASNSLVGTPGTPVVVATHSDLLRFASSSLESGQPLLPGAYQLSTGDSGVSKAMATLAALSGVLGMAGSRFLTVPHPKCVPELVALSTSNAAPSNSASKKMQQEPDLSLEDITRLTSQFPLLWLCVFGNATGGLALLTSSKLMFADIWTGVAPDLVTPAFATAYVTALGAGMAIGRLGWSAASDRLGRQTTYAIFGLGIPIVALSPALTRAAVDASNAAAATCGVVDAAATTSLVVAPMVAAFCGGSVLAVTFYGGVFSVLPGYVADLFGTKHASALVGKLLTAFAASAVVGPMGLAYLRSHATTQSIQQLLVEVHDRDAFVGAFGCSVDDLDSIQKLMDAKTITIARLMELVPPGTMDPTPFLYDTTCYGAATLMGVSFAANYFIRQPVVVAGGAGRQ